MKHPVRPWKRGRRGSATLLGTVALAGIGVVVLSVRELAGSVTVVGTRAALAPRRPPTVTANELVPIVTADARAVNAARPFAGVPDPPAPPFVYDGDNLARARDCLAAAAWWEAGDYAPSEAAVAQVVLNRLRHPAFPKTVCGVVWQGAERATGCQFTFTCDGSMASRRPSPVAWARAVAVAQTALAGRVMGDVGLATHYHTINVLPVWSASLLKVAAVGPHLFLRWPGFWGERRSWLRVRLGHEPDVAALAPYSSAHTDPLAHDTTVSPETADLSPVGASYPREALADARPLRAAPVDRGQRNTRFEVALARDQSGGNWALEALRVCRGKPDCMVEGRFAVGDKGVPAFVYRRTPAGDSVRWNCTVVQRPDPAQCLDAAAR